MSIDWNLPALTSNYSTGVLSVLKAQINAVLTGIADSGDTNVVTGRWRFNLANFAIDTWNGSAWSALFCFYQPGDFKYSAIAASHYGWLLADGSVVSQSTYAALYAAIGASYNTGGEGGGNFRLPDMSGRLPLGKAASGTGSTLYASLGSLDHTHSTPAHNHGMGLGSDLNLTSSGAHTTSIEHDHAAASTDTQGSHAHTSTGTTALAGNHSHVVQAVYDSLCKVNAGTPNQHFFGQYYAGSTLMPLGTDTPGDHAHTVTSYSDTQGSHSHSLNLPDFVGNSSSDGSHTHVAGSFAGRIGLVTGGVDGNAAMTSGSNNPPCLVGNWFIKF